MFESIDKIDRQLFLALNSLHSPFFDAVMWLASDLYFWIPLYAWLLWLLYRRYPKRWWMLLIALALMVTVSDQLCNLVKETVMRLRPSHDDTIKSLVHTLNGYAGGMYGFYSGHSSNAFAVAAFAITALGAKRRYIATAVLAYATITSYSRIYLGVHYPADIVAGGMAGSLIGFSIAWLFKKLYYKLQAGNINTRKPGH